MIKINSFIILKHFHRFSSWACPCHFRVNSVLIIHPLFSIPMSDDQRTHNGQKSHFDSTPSLISVITFKNVCKILLCRPNMYNGPTIVGRPTLYYAPQLIIITYGSTNVNIITHADLSILIVIHTLLKNDITHLLTNALGATVICLIPSSVQNISR